MGVNVDLIFVDDHWHLMMYLLMITEIDMDKTEMVDAVELIDNNIVENVEDDMLMFDQRITNYARNKLQKISFVCIFKINLHNLH
jgi:hypothetical protein